MSRVQLALSEREVETLVKALIESLDYMRDKFETSEDECETHSKANKEHRETIQRLKEEIRQLKSGTPE